MKKTLQMITKSTVAGLLLFASAQAQASFFDTMWGNDGCCSDSNRNFWASAEYLYWQLQDSPTTAPLVISDTTYPIVLDDTLVVLGDDKIDNKWRSGGRFALGYWFDCSPCYGIEANYFFLGKERSRAFIASSAETGSEALAVPFIDATTAADSAFVIAEPGVRAGIAERRVSNTMQNAELNALARFYNNDGFEVVGLVGFRYWNFYENFDFSTSSPLTDVAEDVRATFDKFDAENNFYSGQVGVKLCYNSCDFFANIVGKVALGGMCSELKVDGGFTTNEYDGYGTPVDYVGGFFTAPSNIGKHSKTKFAVLPEINVNLGYTFFDCVIVQVGYSALYVNNVVWANQQINNTINTTATTLYSGDTTPVLVGDAEPTARLKTHSLWVHGVSAGLTVLF